MYTIEIKRDKADTAWNVHIHAVVEAAMVRPFKLSGKAKADLLGLGGIVTWQWLGAAWRKLTGDSYVCDIMPVWGQSTSALKYVLKYLQKSPTLDADQRNEYNKALYGTRLVNLFGSWYSTSKYYRFSYKPSVGRPLECQHCGCTVWMTEFALRRELCAFREAYVSAYVRAPTISL